MTEGDRTWTPLSDALTAACSASSSNFHAVPWTGVAGSDEVVWKYRALFGDRMSEIDVSWSSLALDSFFRPVGPLLDARVLAAEAFGVDATYFTTCGSTIANAVAVSSTVPAGGRILVDHTAHQSIHFAVDASRAHVTTTIPAANGRDPDIDRMLGDLAEAHRGGRAYDAVAVTASTYDGMRLRCDTVFPAIAEASPGVTILVDDAWAAVHAFAEVTSGPSPTRAARVVAAAGSDVVVVHSAHKTMRAMRQGAYLHVCGRPGVRERLEQNLFRHHTTSPSWPVLASLDLARAAAAFGGSGEIASALAARERFRTRLAESSNAHRCRVVDAAPSPHYVADPMRVHIRVPDGVDPVAFRDALWHEHRVHIPRVSGRNLVASFTIGVGMDAADGLADALEALEDDPRKLAHRPTLRGVVHNASDFVIAYPPGLPVASPYSQSDGDRAEAENANGAEFFAVAALSSREQQDWL